MLAYVKEHNVQSAAVIGGGLLGLEAAKAVADMKVKSHIIEFAPILMCRQVRSISLFIFTMFSALSHTTFSNSPLHYSFRLCVLYSIRLIKAGTTLSLESSKAWDWKFTAVHGPNRSWAKMARLTMIVYLPYQPCALATRDGMTYQYK